MASEDPFLILAIISVVCAHGLSLWLTSLFSRPGSFGYVLDHPNPRSLHTRPTPRTGGVAIVAAIYIVSAAALTTIGGNLPLISLGLAGLALAAVALMDDLTELSVGLRITVHLTVAIGLVIAGYRFSAIGLPGVDWVPASWLGTVLTIAFIVWMINLYNFMDGMDGFAGGMGVIGFGTFGLLGWWHGDLAFALVGWIVASACAGFLVVNFPPARIFMGDVGSTTLGCFAAGMMLWGTLRGIFPFWLGVLVFSPFIVDATATLLRRLVRGEKVWKPHATHYYQRLVRSGWGHRRTVLLQYVFMFGCSLSALLAPSLPVAMQWGILAAWGAIYGTYFFGVSKFESRVNRSGGSSAPVA